MKDGDERTDSTIVTYEDDFSVPGLLVEGPIMLVVSKLITNESWMIPSVGHTSLSLCPHVILGTGVPPVVDTRVLDMSRLEIGIPRLCCVS